MFRVQKSSGVSRPTVHSSHRPEHTRNPSITIDGTRFDACAFDDTVERETVALNTAQLMVLSLTDGNHASVEFGGVRIEPRKPVEEEETKTVVEPEPEPGPIEPSKYDTVTTMDELPICYKDMNNTDEDVQCMIGPDLGEDGTDPHNGKYVALFMNKTTDERKMVQMDDLGHVNRFRDALALQGWRMVKPPKVNTNQKQTRKERRANERATKKLHKREEARKRAAEERKRRVEREMAQLKSFAKNIK